METSSPISFDAEADDGGMTSLKSILEAMKNIDEVNVTREESGVEDNIFDAYVWHITFIGENEGNVPQIRLSSSNLVATGAGVSFETISEGNAVSGSFQLTLDGATTTSIDSTATSADYCHT